jgi:hypothetical protein
MIVSGIDKVHTSWNTTDLLVQWCYNSMKTLKQLQRTVCLHWLRMQIMCMCFDGSGILAQPDEDHKISRSRNIKTPPA